jgi:hypothetical protein
MFLSPVVNRFLEVYSRFLSTILPHRLYILSGYFLSPVLRSRFAGFLHHKCLTHWLHPARTVRRGPGDGVSIYFKVGYLYLALFLVSFHSLSQLAARSFRSGPNDCTDTLHSASMHPRPRR